MSKLTPKMKEIKEEYKDDPQKQNQEIMGLYKKYGVNPLGGCLPMFVQMPVFLGFYRMLSSAVELRHESFLWVTDLSMPDTLFEIPGLNIPFNLLPLLMAVTMVIQMKVAPQSGDATQRMIFMLMPVVFLVICYNFASALSLYWTTTNIFSIFQTLLMNKLPEPELKTKKLPEGGTKKKGFMQRLQDQAEAQQKAKKNQVAGEKGNRHTPGKSKKRKKR
jgi:YidC/Oxa1 family membrane protein insertase